MQQIWRLWPLGLSNGGWLQGVSETQPGSERLKHRSAFIIASYLVWMEADQNQEWETTHEKTLGKNGQHSVCIGVLSKGKRV